MGKFKVDDKYRRLKILNMVDNENGPCRIKDLHEAHGGTKSYRNTRRIINNLVQNGKLEKINTEGWHGDIRVVITKKGKEYLQYFEREHPEFINRRVKP